ncbi:paraquat-inducible protein A [Aestuariibacter halophilus]|uniref:Paraquat-inducible protein A n=1 Tax=Fluctibacter halophilus TaxID=226011 RepID=A0ABS8GBH7_9ALTE|nr:paraquat-inducible protein A [Aestuariibacter halophilus]MCC2617421.1 paraquat-inducible protein A [Aestuariibacter halophilus]
MRKHVGGLLNLLALGLFIPGILLPMFTLSMTLQGQIAGQQLTTPLIDKTLSIITTISELWHDDRRLVASLILAFSVLLPVFKTTLLVLAYVLHHRPVSRSLINTIDAIGKWAMADVFVVAVFLAVLSTDHSGTRNDYTFSVFGFSLDMQISTATVSQVGNGFYFFCAYCLVAMLATALLRSSHNAVSVLQPVGRPDALQRLD